MEKQVLLYDFVHKAMKNLEKKDITYAEAFFTTTCNTEVTIRNAEILTQNTKEDCGVGFRVASGGKVGFACTNRLSEEAVGSAAEKAFDIARVSSEVPHFALPGPGPLSHPEGLYHSEVDSIEIEDAVDIAKRAIAAAENVDPRIVVKSGRVSFQSIRQGIINNLGVDCQEPRTKASLYMGGTGESNGEVTGFCSDSVYTRTADLEPEKIGESVGEKVCEMFNPQPAQKFQGTVIFGPEVTSYQLTDVLIDALRGDSVAAGRSAWTQKVEQKVASDMLTVTDDPLLENGYFSRGFDDEGCPSQNTLLIQEGELVQFLHNATSAETLKTENTGNASRFYGGFDLVASIVGSGYRTIPEIYASNLMIQPGTHTQEDLISEVEKGVLIESMDGFAQVGSGLVSARLARAFFIKNGEVQYPLKGGMVSGVAFDWFNRISGVGSDVKQFRNEVVPSLRVDDVTVVGA